MENNRAFLTRAIQIAEKGIEDGCGPFGAVITKDGEILAEAVNRVITDSDPTAHAEVVAIREAASVLRSHDLNGCILYCSCEPCPMCLGAIYWAGIKQVVYACDRNDAAAAGFSDKYIYNEILLEPAERKIGFLKLDYAGGEEVFKKWEKNENRIPY
jgi:guanine deaminase